MSPNAHHFDYHQPRVLDSEPYLSFGDFRIICMYIEQGRNVNRNKNNSKAEGIFEEQIRVYRGKARCGKRGYDSVRRG